MKKPTVERLQLGKAYHYCDGKAYRVGLLNECRARLDPLFRKRRTITSRLHGVSVTIHATAPSVSISAMSMLPPVRVR